MKTAGIIINRDMLPIYQRHLNAGGYSYTEQAGPFADALLLRVRFFWMYKLMRVVKAASLESRQRSA